MTSTHDHDGKGFGGFSDLVSDVSKDLESARRTSPSAPINQSQPKENPSTATPQVSPPQASEAPGTGSGAKWFWGFAIGLAVLIYFIISGRNESQPYVPRANYQPPASIPAPAARAPAPAAAPVAQRAPPSVTNPLNEERPPVGDGIALSREQIRYCVSQKLRLDTIEKIVKDSQGQVDSYNALVNDYNSRCSHFKYRKGVLEDVRAEVEGRRATLEAASKSAWLQDVNGVNNKKNSSDKAKEQSKTRNQPTKPIAAPSAAPLGTGKVKSTRDSENYKMCIAGDYPSLCKHGLLVGNDVADVAAAERRANYKTCIAGDYPGLCKHSLLVGSEISDVSAAERRARNK